MTHPIQNTGSPDDRVKDLKKTGEIVAQLQSSGLKVRGETEARKGGAGPSDGIVLVVLDRPVNVLVRGALVEKSPFSLKVTPRGGHLFRNGEEVFPVGLVGRPGFYHHKTADDIPYPRIALLHGKDCLATTVVQRCHFWRSGSQCRFCAIEVPLADGTTLERKSPDQLAEVARAAKELDQVRHVTLTTGTERFPKKTIQYLSRCVRSIKEAAGLPVQVQIVPPKDPESLAILKEAGADTIGVHVETFDPHCRLAVTPAKSRFKLARYQRAWRKAVELFGRNQVESFLLAGLGESRESIINGAGYLASEGVYPFVLPFRPLPGSLLEESTPPPADYMIGLYEEIGAILEKERLSARRSKAGCVRCGACSALPFFETNREVVVREAVTGEELREVFAIRKAVFVEELKIFKETDQDEQDGHASYLIALIDDEIVGTVRAYPLDDGTWVGGRMAVKAEHRGTPAAALLEKECVRLVKRKQGVRFIAYILEANVPFFEWLGWKTIQKVAYHGLPHRLMEADLTGDRNL